MAITCRVRAPRHGARGSPSAAPDLTQVEDGAAAPTTATVRRHPSRAQARPHRANADGRWGARKNATESPSSKPCRADAVERWDANKTVKIIRPAQNPGRQEHRQSRPRVGVREVGQQQAPPCRDWEPRVIRGAWDAHKKPRLPQAGGIDDDDGQSSTGSNDMELNLDELSLQRAFYAGPGFLASPEPSMLPMPSSLMVRVAA
uniref:Uncharacterized protein n=1 Tax=Setaria viridis TaxID=4556 RepID=A0A4V6D8I5_SETVI|nr:hypothetical protein SEVIR_4G219100v2 [Setaria viridis]